MNENLKAVKKRVKKLLALSKSPNQNEALAALEKARRLMREYALSESECVYAAHSVKATKRVSEWRVVLAAAVAWLNYCEALRDATRGEMVFYGDEFDAFMAAEMYRYLSKTIERMAKRNIRETASAAYRKSYKYGAAYQLNRRIHELGGKVSWGPEHEVKRLAVREAMNKALTVVSGKVSGGMLVSTSAFQRGATDGNRIPLNRQTTGHGGRYVEAKQ
jgi:hypothetical protein